MTAAGIFYRRCTTDDAHMLANLRGEDESGGAGEERMHGYIEGTYYPGEALDPRVVFAAFNGDRCAGYIAGHLTTRYQCDGELEWIYVTPDHRGTEVASVLMRHLAEWFVERNARRICVDVEPQNAIARRYYAKHGAKPFKPYWMLWDDIAVALVLAQGDDIVPIPGTRRRAQ